MRTDEELLQAYLDGELDGAAIAALEVRLRDETALAEALVKLARHEAIISEWASATRTAQALGAAPARKLAFPRRVAAVIVASAAAAALFLALSGFFFTPPDETVAQLVDVAGDVSVVQKSGESKAATRGQRLSIGQSLRTRGEGSFAVVTFPDTTRLEVGADTSIQLLLNQADPTRRKDNKVFLEQGVVAADVTQQPVRPVLLATPHGEALLDSRSSFAIAPEGTRIEPEKGAVRFTRKSDGQSVAVPQGWYAVAAAANANPMVARPMPEPRLAIAEPAGAVFAAAFAPNGLILAGAGAEGLVKLWDPATGAALQVLKGHRGRVRALAFSQDGGLLATAGDDRRIILWDPHTGVELGSLKGSKGAIEALAFSPDGVHLVSGGVFQANTSNLPEVRVWNVVGRQEVANLAEHTAGVLAVAFSPDGKLLATAGRDKTVRLWDAEKFKVLQVLQGHQGPVNTVAFSPDGSLLASGGQDRTIRFWDVGLGTERSVMPGYAPQVRSIAFSPNGQFLAAGDNGVRIWNLSTGRERLIFKGAKQVIHAVAFSPDGKTIAAAAADKTIRLWDLMEATTGE